MNKACSRIKLETGEGGKKIYIYGQKSVRISIRKRKTYASISKVSDKLQLKELEISKKLLVKDKLYKYPVIHIGTNDLFAQTN